MAVETDITRLQFIMEAGFINGLFSLAYLQQILSIQANNSSKS